MHRRAARPAAIAALLACLLSVAAAAGWGTVYLFTGSPEATVAMGSAMSPADPSAPGQLTPAAYRDNLSGPA